MQNALSQCDADADHDDHDADADHDDHDADADHDADHDHMMMMIIMMIMIMIGWGAFLTQENAVSHTCAKSWQIFGKIFHMCQIFRHQWKLIFSDTVANRRYFHCSDKKNV